MSSTGSFEESNMMTVVPTDESMSALTRPASEAMIHRNEVLEHAVTKLAPPVIARHLQPLYRGYRMRVACKEMMRCVLVMQTFARQHMQRKRYDLAKRAALKLSKTYRMHHVVDQSPAAKLITKARLLEEALEEERNYERFAVESLMSSAPLLLPGSTVALWNSVHGRFLRSDDGRVDGHSVRAEEEVPADHWDPERFTVKACGNGAVALRAHDGMFLRMVLDDAAQHAHVDAALPEPASVLDEAAQQQGPAYDPAIPAKYHGHDALQWLPGEFRFKVVQVGKNEIALYNDKAARFVKMTSKHEVDGDIFIDPATKKRPKGKRFHDVFRLMKHWERFKVVHLELPYNTPPAKRDALALADYLVEYAKDPYVAKKNPEFVKALTRTLMTLRDLKRDTTSGAESNTALAGIGTVTPAAGGGGAPATSPRLTYY